MIELNCHSILITQCHNPYFHPRMNVKGSQEFRMIFLLVGKFFDINPTRERNPYMGNIFKTY